MIYHTENTFQYIAPARFFLFKKRNLACFFLRLSAHKDKQHLNCCSFCYWSCDRCNWPLFYSKKCLQLSLQ